MTLDQIQQRDDRIAALEALGRARTRDQDHELGSLRTARDQFWRRLPQAHATALRRMRELEAYACQHRLPLGHAA